MRCSINTVPFQQGATYGTVRWLIQLYIATLKSPKSSWRPQGQHGRVVFASKKQLPHRELNPGLLSENQVS